MSKYKTNKNEAELPTKKNVDNMFNTLTRLSRKMARIKQQILREIEEDSLFNNLTSLNQSYSF